MKERIQKVLSNLGVMSRRKAEAAISEGQVSVNGKKAKLGDLVDIKKDTLVVNKKVIKYSEVKKYYIFNKPAGCLCTHEDPEGRKTIFDYMKLKTFVSYVGRLDYNSEGLVMLTNDGEMKEFLTNPKNKIEREYKVKVSRKVDREQIPEMMKPVYIDGRKLSPEKIRILKQNDNNCWISITVLEGINREIRKMCEAWGLKVSRLIRVRFGPIRITGLNKGFYRELGFNEVKNLKNLMESREKKVGKNKKNR